MGTPEKRKHEQPLGEPVDDDVVDIDALVNDYQNRYQDMPRPGTAERLGEPSGESGASKRKNTPPPPPRVPRAPGSRKETEWGAEVEQAAQDFGSAAEQFGRDAERWGKDFSKNWRNKQYRAGLKDQIEHFLRTPYEPGYQAEYDPDTTTQERNAAALAHASAWLSSLVSIFSAGILFPVAIFFPLIIYFMNREKSPFVARHALQAFVAQLSGTIGWVALLTVSGMVGVLLTILLAITIVGIFVIPFLWLALVLFWVASLAIPFGVLGCSIIGALNALQGKTYDYPYVGKWVK